MELRALTDEQAVSPVIGVILMVAITVILAAVIASFVLGLGPSESTPPKASFAFDYEGATHNVTITHDGGETIRESELYLRGTGFNGSFPNQASNGNDPAAAVDHTDAGQWQGSTSGTIGEDSAVVSGDRAVVHVDSDYELQVVYQSRSGETSATLGEDVGPDE